MAQTDYNTIELSAWTQVGEGGTGKAYANPARPDVILKVNNKRLNSLEVVQHEYDVSKAVEELGLSIPKVYEIVRAYLIPPTFAQKIFFRMHVKKLVKKFYLPR